MRDSPGDPWALDRPARDPDARHDQQAGPVESWRRWWTAQAAATGDELADLARRQGFVVSTRQLRERGWALHDQRRAVRRGELWVPLRGTASPIMLDTTADDQESAFLLRRKRHALSATAAVLLRPDHGVSGRSAAILHGLPTVSVPSLPELTACEEDTLGRRAGAHVYGAGVMDADVTNWFGAPVLTIARTVVDLARHDRSDAIMAVDAALRASLVDAVALRRSLAQATGWAGVRQAREVLALGDPRAESPLESITRLALHDDDFPPPQLQVWLGRDRVDLCWPERRLVLEADGRVKYTGDALWQEKLRETRLRALGFRVERVTWYDVLSNWPATSRRLRSA